MIWGALCVSLSITRTSFSLLASLPQGIRPLTFQSSFVISSQNLNWGSMCPPSFAKWHAKVSTYYPVLPSCLRASPDASRVVDNWMFFFNLSSSSNFRTWASASSWTLVTVHSRGQPSVGATALPSLPQYALPCSSHKHIGPAGILGPYSYSRVCLQAPNIYTTLPK